MKNLVWKPLKQWDTPSNLNWFSTRFLNHQQPQLIWLVNNKQRYPVPRTCAVPLEEVAGNARDSWPQKICARQIGSSPQVKKIIMEIQKTFETTTLGFGVCVFFVCSRFSSCHGIQVHFRLWQKKLIPKKVLDPSFSFLKHLSFPTGDFWAGGSSLLVGDAIQLPQGGS